MTAWFGQRGRKSLMAIAIAALFMLNLNGVLAAGDDNAWPGPASAAMLSSSSASIGDRVWHDYDGKGDQENDLGLIEPGLDGVKVYLYRDNGDGVFDRNTDTELGWDITESGTSSDGYPDGIYGFGIEPGEYDYWVWVDESTLPTGQWTLTTESNPRKVSYTGDDDFSVDFGYQPLADPTDAEPTAVALSSFAASSESRSPLFDWSGLVALATVIVVVALWRRRQR